MPGLIKIGMTTKVPEERAKELSDATSTPTPFIVEYYAIFDDMQKAEKLAHNKLYQYHHGKEFFKIDVVIAIQIIESLGLSFTKLHSKPEDDQKVRDLHYRESLKRREEERIAEKKTIEIEEAERRNRKKREEFNEVVEKAKMLAINFSGEYKKESLAERLKNTSDSFFEAPFNFFEKLTFDKSRCPSIEEIIVSPYGPGREPDDKNRLNWLSHIRYCDKCKLIHNFFTKVAKGASCLEQYELWKYMRMRSSIDSNKRIAIEQHIDNCERCKYIERICEVSASLPK